MEQLTGRIKLARTLKYSLELNVKLQILESPSARVKVRRQIYIYIAEQNRIGEDTIK